MFSVHSSKHQGKFGCFSWADTGPQTRGAAGLFSTGAYDALSAGTVVLDRRDGYWLERRGEGTGAGHRAVPGGRAGGGRSFLPVVLPVAAFYASTASRAPKAHAGQITGSLCTLSLAWQEERKAAGAQAGIVYFSLYCAGLEQGWVQQRFLYPFVPYRIAVAIGDRPGNGPLPRSKCRLRAQPSDPAGGKGSLHHFRLCITVSTRALLSFIEHTGNSAILLPGLLPCSGVHLMVPDRLILLAGHGQQRFYKSGLHAKLFIGDRPACRSLPCLVHHPACNWNGTVRHRLLPFRANRILI